MQKLILLMGLPGSGKTWFASRLAAKLGFMHISSDRTRKRMQKNGMYSDADKMQVYWKMQDDAKRLLDSGKSVILDATFYKEEIRRIFINLCRRQAVPAYGVLLYADEEIVRDRLSRKRISSEADFNVYKKLRADFEPFSMDFLVLQSGRESLETMLKRTGSYINHRHEPARNPANITKERISG